MGYPHNMAFAADHASTDDVIVIESPPKPHLHQNYHNLQPTHPSPRPASRPASRASSRQHAPYPIAPAPALVRPDLPLHHYHPHPHPHHVRQYYPPPSSSRHSGSRRSSRVSRDTIRHDSHQGSYWHSDSSPDSFAVDSQYEDKSVFSHPSSQAQVARQTSSSRDLEKEFLHPSPPSSHASLHQIKQYHEDGDDDDAATTTSNKKSTTFRALINLATIVPFLSVLVALYTLVVVTFSTFGWPVTRLLRKDSPGLATSIRNRLSSSALLLLRCVYQAPDATPSQLPPPSQSPSSSIRANVPALLLAPFIAFPLALASWVVACFWLLNALIADEGSGRGDGHGMTTTLVDWWVYWVKGYALGN